MSGFTLEKNLFSANSVEKGSLQDEVEKSMKEVTQVKNHISVNFVLDNSQLVYNAECMPKARVGALKVLDTKIEL